VKKKMVVLSMVVGLAMLLPMMVYFVNPDSRIRFQKLIYLAIQLLWISQIHGLRKIIIHWQAKYLITEE